MTARPLTRPFALAAVAIVAALSLVVYGPVGRADAFELRKLPVGAATLAEAVATLTGTGAAEITGGGVASGAVTTCAAVNVACPELALGALTAGVLIVGGYYMWKWTSGYEANHDLPLSSGYDGFSWAQNPGLDATGKLFGKVVYQQNSSGCLTSPYSGNYDTCFGAAAQIRFLRASDGLIWTLSGGIGSKSFDSALGKYVWDLKYVGGTSGTSVPGNSIVSVEVQAKKNGNLQDVIYWGTPITPPVDMPAPNPNPTRRIHSETQCIKVGDVPGELSSPGSAPRRTVQAYSNTFHETDASLPQIPVPACASDEVAVHQKSTKETNSGTDTAPSWSPATNPLIEVTPNPASWDPTKTPAECVPGGASYPCTLQIQRKVTQPDGTTKWENCLTGEVSCTDWDISTDTDIANNPDYRCRYGSSTVAMDECTRVYPKNPVTPIFDPVPPDPADASGDGCAPSGWQLLNPMAYVKSTVCIIKWAFVPSAIGTQFDELMNTVKTRPPASFVLGGLSGIGALWDGYNNGTCNQNDSPEFSPIAGKHLRLPCTPPLGDNYDALLAIMRGGLWLTTGFALWKMADAAFGDRGGE